MAKPKYQGIEVSEEFINQALGFVKTMGLTDIPQGTKQVLEIAVNHGLCSQQKIDSAQEYYLANYYFS